MPYLRQVPLGKSIRMVTVRFPAVAVNASTGKTNLVTFDDFRWRHLVGFFTTSVVKLLLVELDIAGRVFADIDVGEFIPAQGMLHQDQWFPPGVIVSYNVFGGPTGIGANTDSFSLVYEADPDVTPPGP